MTNDGLGGGRSEVMQCWDGRIERKVGAVCGKGI